MAHTVMTMTANSGDEFAESKCVGCYKPFRSGQRMNAMEYENGESAGWHCDDCVSRWKLAGESSLPRWKEAP